jgi:intracellular multiplication protein IcmW
MDMPDLSGKEVHKFWHEYEDPVIYKVLSFMDNVEDWTLDGNSELEESISKLGKALDEIGYVDLQSEDKLIQIATSIKAGRAIRLLHCIDTAHPGAASKIITYAKNETKSADDVFGLFLRRNVVFERLRILDRVFGADRLTQVQDVLGEKGEQQDA